MSFRKKGTLLLVWSSFYKITICCFSLQSGRLRNAPLSLVTSTAHRDCQLTYPRIPYKICTYSRKIRVKMLVKKLRPHDIHQSSRTLGVWCYYIITLLRTPIHYIIYLFKLFILRSTVAIHSFCSHLSYVYTI